MSRIGLALGIAAILIVYYAACPIFWPPPAVEITVTEGSKTEPPTVRAVLSSMHRNMHFTEIRIVTDVGASTALPPKDPALPPKDPALPLILHREPPQVSYEFWGISREIWPTKIVKRAAIPLDRITRDGHLRAGRFAGTVTVEYEYATVLVDRLASSQGFYPAITGSAHEEFSLEVEAR